MGVACQPTKPPPPPGPPTEYCALTTPATASAYQNAFNGLRGAGTGWLASDGALPVDLEDGRILWMFGDTIRSDGPGVRNSFVVQDGRCFRPIFEPLGSPGGDHWYWPAAAVLENGALRVFALRMMPGPGTSPLDSFEYVRMDVVTLALPNLNFVSRQEVPIPTAGSLPSFGQTVLVADDAGTEFVYAYGKTTTPVPNFFPIVRHFVARVPLGSVLTASEWQVWDGSTWVSDAGEAEPLPFDPDGAGPKPQDTEAGPLAPLAVASVAGGVLGSALDVDAFGDQLGTWDSPAPQGPFTFRAVAFDIWPTSAGAPPNRLGYGGRVVFNVAPTAIALWSVNHTGANPDPSLYEVRFAEPAAASVP